VCPLTPLNNQPPHYWIVPAEGHRKNLRGFQTDLLLFLTFLLPKITLVCNIEGKKNAPCGSSLLLPPPCQCALHSLINAPALTDELRFDFLPTNWASEYLASTGNCRVPELLTQP